MAITRVNTKEKASGGGGASTLTTPTFSATTGNLIVVGIRTAASGESISSVSDTAGNTYTSIDSNTTQDPHMRIYYAKNITGNASNAVTVTLSVSATFFWIQALEYSGCDTTAPLDIHGNTTGTGTTDLTTSAFTTTNANEVVILWASQNNFATYSAHTDSLSNTWTLIAGNIGNADTGNGFGGSEEFIASSTLSSDTAHITSTVTNQYTIVWASFIAASSGASFIAAQEKPILQAVNRASTY